MPALLTKLTEGRITNGAKEPHNMSLTEELASINVLQTKNYSKFSYIPGNRAISKGHVQELMLSFQKNPALIALRPILVNEKLQVIDGQHRLQACEGIGEPVPYIVFPGLSVATAQLLNALQRPWGMQDYAKSYAISGNKHYKEVLKYADNYELPLSTLLVYLGNGRRKTLSRDFRAGIFKMRDDASSLEQQLEQLESFGTITPFWNSAAFALAFWNVLKIENYDHERMLRSYGKSASIRQSTRLDYLRDFERAYNEGRSTNIARFF